MSEPQPIPSAPATKTQNGLSTTSLVLGVLSPFCLLVFTGIPAIITGHIAYGRAKRQPHVYGGAGLAMVGLVLGYISIFTTVGFIVLGGLLLPALAKAKGKAQVVQCASNMKQIGLAARIWSNDHNEMYPPDFLTMANELNSPRFLVCPSDTKKTKVEDWSQFNPSQNVTYEFLTPGAKEADITTQAAFRCPIHNNIGLGDGSVQQTGGRRR